MFGNFITKLLTFALHRANLTLSNRNELTKNILDKLVALPLSAIIETNEQGSLVVNGKTLTLEGARALKEASRNVLNNPARKFIHEQVLFVAVTLGVHKVESENQMFFSRAAIWYAQQEDILLKQLAGSESELDP